MNRIISLDIHIHISDSCDQVWFSEYLVHTVCSPVSSVLEGLLFRTCWLLLFTALSDMLLIADRS